tara:strand:- start:558 stop:974 length:417 start_codon:yes stop_codon:yes gene_type:complete
MAILNATDVVLKVTVGGALVPVAHSTSASISMNMDLRDSTTKSSEGWQENLGGLRSYELSGDSFVDITAVAGSADILELWTAYEARTAIAVEFGATGIVYTGDAFITSLSIDAGVEENATFSVSLTGTGRLRQNGQPA